LTYFDTFAQLHENCISVILFDFLFLPFFAFDINIYLVDFLEMWYGNKQLISCTISQNGFLSDPIEKFHNMRCSITCLQPQPFNRRAAKWL